MTRHKITFALLLSAFIFSLTGCVTNPVFEGENAGATEPAIPPVEPLDGQDVEGLAEALTPDQPANLKPMVHPIYVRRRPSIDRNPQPSRNEAVAPPAETWVNQVCQSHTSCLRYAETRCADVSSEGFDAWSFSYSNPDNWTFECSRTEVYTDAP